MDFLSGLNPPQREAAAQVDGPLLILAGAGSGKTRVITHRIAHIITAQYAPASAVLAVTFTNKAAAEMRERVRRLLASDAPSATPNVSTFHSFCVRLLRRDGAPLTAIRPGFTRTFTIYDADDQLALIKAAYKRLGLDDSMFMPPRAALSRISAAKNRKESPDEALRKANDPNAARLASLFEEYEKSLRNANALDFDDLLLETVRLLRHDAATRDAWNRRLSYLMIDEYQDTNRSQYELMRLLTTSHKNVCVVGDEDQSIYSWRGADIRNILDFEHDYPDARVIRLEQNYRSTKNILAAAGGVVANNRERKGKTLWTDAAEGDRIGLYAAFDGANEGLFIADSIEKAIARDPRVRVAVLYRTNFQSRLIEEALRRYRRKYLVVGGTSFYQRAEVKDVLSYLKLAMLPRDPVSLRRVINTPARGIGKSTIDEIEQYSESNGLNLWDSIGRMLEEKAFGTRADSAVRGFRRLIQNLSETADTKPLRETVKFAIDETGYRRMLEEDKSPDAEGRVENLDELLNAAAEAADRGEGLADFLDHAALVAEADSLDEKAQVTLMTMHNAKGLEFPVVFVAGLEEGLFPHSRALEVEAGMEEERRLCYVGMTRAQVKLTLTYARYRRRFGGGDLERTIPSRFLKEVPPHLIADLSENSARGQLDLTAERHAVRESAKRNVYTGKTYDSVAQIPEFFAKRGLNPPAQAPPPPRPPAAAARTAKSADGMTVEHPKYGIGTVVRREGEGEDAKLLISFQKYGLKKLVERYAGLKRDR
jgi:DNA helicase-2/ATP-dependent DNA helicase PcrA